MDVVLLITESINQNSYLTPEIKTDIIDLISVFHDKIPNVDLNNFNDRIKTLKITSGSKYEMKDIASYDGIKNILYLNKESFNIREGKNILMYGLLQVITSNGKYSGFNENSKLEALNMGVSELIVDYLVGSDF